VSQDVERFFSPANPVHQPTALSQERYDCQAKAFCFLNNESNEKLLYFIGLRAMVRSFIREKCIGDLPAEVMNSGQL
jgi:hypothetical protein